MHQVPPPCPEARTSEGIPTMGKIHSHHGNVTFPRWESGVSHAGKQNITNITTNITPNYLIIKTSDVCDIFLAKIKNIVRVCQYVQHTRTSDNGSPA